MRLRRAARLDGRLRLVCELCRHILDDSRRLRRLVVAGGRRSGRARRGQRKAEVPELRAHDVGDVEGQPAAARRDLRTELGGGGLQALRHRNTTVQPGHRGLHAAGALDADAPELHRPLAAEGPHRRHRARRLGPHSRVRHRGLDLRVDLFPHERAAQLLQARGAPLGELRAVYRVDDRGGPRAPLVAEVHGLSYQFPLLQLTLRRGALDPLGEGRRLRVLEGLEAVGVELLGPAVRLVLVA